MPRPIDAHAAVLFDLDGVLTPTAEVHRRAWKRTFDRLLAAHFGAEFEPFTAEDYLRYVDGKPRYDGVHSFLRSRGIVLPAGEPADPPSLDSESGVGNTKNLEFRAVLDDEGVEPYPGSISLLEHLEANAVAVAVVSSSANAKAVLTGAGLGGRFEVIIDGVVARQRKLRGKPAPDTFLTAAADLGVHPSDAVVVEDAISGIEAGVAGGFGLVVGVDRERVATNMLAAGAHVVVDDLAELLPGPGTQTSASTT